MKKRERRRVKRKVRGNAQERRRKIYSYKEKLTGLIVNSLKSLRKTENERKTTMYIENNESYGEITGI